MKIITILFATLTFFTSAEATTIEAFDVTSTIGDLYKTAKTAPDGPRGSYTFCGTCSESNITSKLLEKPLIQTNASTFILPNGAKCSISRSSKVIAETAEFTIEIKGPKAQTLKAHVTGIQNGGFLIFSDVDTDMLSPKFILLRINKV